MDTHITGTGLTLTPEIRKYFERQQRKVEKLVRNPAGRLEVELVHLTERRTDDEFRAELMVKAPGKDLRAEASSMSLHGAIDQAVERLLVELRKVKGKKLRLFKLEGLKYKNLLRFGRAK